MPITDRLTPVLRDRIRTALGGRWPRALAPRRILAAALLLAAVLLALRPDPGGGPPTRPMLVAARDLAPGSALTATDVRVVRAPETLRPPSAFEAVEAVTGRVLAGPAGTGEPITAARLLGPENTRLITGGPDAVAVPVRLTDPAVADLLGPGVRVDVVSVDPKGGAGVLLASDVTVVTVRNEDHDRVTDGRLVVIGMPREAATRVASTALGQPVTVTLR
ncbi:SAF domain-containing protein [Actinophytocola sp.]|uniref:SAF domain-containing protein n=1 Tax=Actinophytocola sp. TaxID=1872138 RepID=UPI002D7FE706|nr:SAF domain-containing protein [Actinophytocola sp.]HET9140321.1 SAF domain-containing protein [Actinophytocola sp.]